MRTAKLNARACPPSYLTLPFPMVVNIHKHVVPANSFTFEQLPEGPK